jgi:hypothetical protein
VGEPAFVPPKWRKPAPLGYGSAIDSLGSVAAPLLAGFSLASVIIVSDDSVNFRWPGAVVLALAIAAVALIGSVQCAYYARQYLWSGAEVSDWWPEMKADTGLETLLRREQAEAFYRWGGWIRWARTTYDFGIMALLAGLGLGLVPLHDSGFQSSLRWAAVSVAFVACVGEAAWIVIASWRRSVDARSDGRSS